MCLFVFSKNNTTYNKPQDYDIKPLQICLLYMQYEILPIRRKTLNNQLYIHTLVRKFIYIKNYAFLWMFGHTASRWDFFSHRNYTCKHIVKALLNPKATEILEKHWGATEKHWGYIDVYF